MKISYLVIILLVCVFSLMLSPIAESKNRTAAKTSITSKKQSNSYSRNFYRSLSKRHSKNRLDYPHLTDLEFANFRAVTTTGMGKGKLYRSSSPVNPWGNRNLIADNAARAVGIKTFVNLADTEKKYRATKVSGTAITAPRRSSCSASTGSISQRSFSRSSQGESRLWPTASHPSSFTATRARTEPASSVPSSKLSWARPPKK